MAPEHPIEVARKALIAAAEQEGESMASALRRVASSLPERPQIASRDALPLVNEWQTWLGLPIAERKHRILNVLGEDTLTTNDLSKRVGTAYPDCATGGDGLRALLQELFDAGEVERSKNSQRRWLYRRRLVLSPEITALQRALDETAGA